MGTYWTLCAVWEYEGDSHFRTTVFKKHLRAMNFSVKRDTAGAQLVKRLQLERIWVFTLFYIQLNLYIKSGLGGTLNWLCFLVRCKKILASQYKNNLITFCYFWIISNTMCPLLRDFAYRKTCLSLFLVTSNLLLPKPAYNTTWNNLQTTNGDAAVVRKHICSSGCIVQSEHLVITANATTSFKYKSYISRTIQG